MAGRARAALVVYSDGNHHMALGECLERFLAANPAVDEVFYATTPPHVIVQALRAGRLRIGNLEISAAPHLFFTNSGSRRDISAICAPSLRG